MTIKNDKVKIKIIFTIAATILISLGFIPSVIGAIPPPKYDGTIGVVTVGFDHGFKDQFQPMLYMKNNNFSGTMWVVTNRSPSQNPNFMPWSQLQSLYNMGFEMASHSRTHIDETSGLSNSTLYSEIYGSKLDLQTEGFKVCGFIPPGNYKNATVTAIINKFYNYSETIGLQNTLESIAQSKSQNGIPYVNSEGVANLDPTQLSYLQNFSAVKSQIDSAIQTKSYLQIHFHDIVNQTTDFTGLQYPTSFSLFQHIIDYLKSKSDSGLVRIESVSQVLGYGKQCEIITDKTLPTITVPSNVTAMAASSGGIRVNYTVTATDNVGLLRGPTCNPTSGSLFLIGNTTVTCVATDWANNTSTNSFVVTVSKSATNISINSISNIPWGNTVTITGKLTNGSGMGIANELVSFNGTGATNLIQTVTNATGFFTSFGVAPSVVSGWTVQAHFTGDSTYHNSDSIVTSYSTLGHQTQIAIVLQPSSVLPGGSYIVSGALKDQTTGTSLASKIIMFKTTFPISINNAVTNVLGKFVVSGLVAPSNPGTYKIQAKFAGDSLYNASSPPAKTLTVS